MKALIRNVVRYLLMPLPRPANSDVGKLYIRWRLGWLRGLWYRAGFALRRRAFGPRVVGGAGLSVQGALRVRGPGTVVLGREVTIGSPTDIFTHSRDAVVVIGDGTFLNGTRFGCQRSIRVGRNSIVADARIMDTDFHSLYRERHSPDAPIAVAPVTIGDNVWIAAGVFVLKGVSIGENSVVGCAAVVTKDVPADSIVAGNPARVAAKVPRLRGSVCAAGSGSADEIMCGEIPPQLRAAAGGPSQGWPSQG